MCAIHNADYQWCFCWSYFVRVRPLFRICLPSFPCSATLYSARARLPFRSQTVLKGLFFSFRMVYVRK